jgi:hypothetical protein
MLVSDAETLDEMVRFDRAAADAQRPPAMLLPLPLWERDRIFLLAWMFQMTGLRPKLSTLLISIAIVDFYRMMARA